MPDLNTIFGSAITVTPQPPDWDKSYTGFAGAHGLVAMDHGSRGRNIVVTGRLEAEGASYAAARTALLSSINTISAYRNNSAATMTYKGETYNYVIFTPFLTLRRDGSGKAVRWDGSKCFCFFECVLRQLIC